MCGVVKPLSEFHRDASKRDGHKAVCAKCRMNTKHQHSSRSTRCRRDSCKAAEGDNSRLCQHCGRSLTRESFNKGTKADGLQTYCRECSVRYLAIWKKAAQQKEPLESRMQELDAERKVLAEEINRIDEQRLIDWEADKQNIESPLNESAQSDLRDEIKALREMIADLAMKVGQ